MARFKLDDKVRIVRTGGDILEGATGSILGPYGFNEGGYYIVLLDRPLADRRAVVFTEHCLEGPLTPAEHLDSIVGIFVP